MLSTLLQTIVILCLAMPFLIPVFKKHAKRIPLIQIVIFLICLLFLYQQKDNLPLKLVFGGWQHTIGIEILLDVNALLFLAATYIVFLSVIIYSSKKGHDWKYYFLINLLLSDLTCLFLANDLFNIYVTLELMSLISYLLISMEFKSRQIWSSLKYMILSAVSFNLYLVATAMIYNEYGTLNIDLIATHVIKNPFSLFLLTTALLIKSGIFFYSMWLPSAHSDSESSISAILSGVIVNAGIFHVLRINNAINCVEISRYIIIIGIVSAIFGAYFSIKQKDIKLILAFSTLSQMGFILEGLSSYGPQYAFSHAIFKALLFLCAGYYQQLFSTRNIETSKKEIPISLFLAIWIGFFSISGLPFFLGSYYKHEIMALTSPFISYGLFFATIGSVISVGKFAFVVRPSKNAMHFSEKDYSIMLLSIICIIFGTLGSINHLDFEHLLEPEILFALGLFVLFTLSKKIKIHYPYKLFKLSNVITIYTVIIGVIVAWTSLAF
ncbi:MAG TPA: proton-conducting transporter membrane subunit [Thermotogota bacterium]|nr:proton-conducting transporter membrane subunit [Thermotogota bacterium]HRW33732.1 proton-conducting transporter membrane subunit [Thermotogota bacterium]